MSLERQKSVRLSRHFLASCHQLFIALILCCSSLAAITARPYSASSIDLRPPPTFTTHRDFVVNENDPIGMRVFRVAVVGGPVTFHIAPGSFKDGSRYFRVDEKSGDFYVKESLKGLGGQDFYFFVFAQVPGSSTKASLECRVRINEVSNDGSSLPSFHPPLGNSPHHFVNSGPRLTPQMSPPRDKPKDTVFELPTTSTTPRPQEKPPADPLNNPKRNQSLPVDMNGDSGEQNIDFEEDTSSRLMRILTTILPFLSLVLFVPFVIFVAWVTYKCQRNVPTRNAIKTFSHKIINNNKSDSSASTTSTTSSSFSSGSTSDYNGALFRTTKSLACKEISAASSNRSLLKVSDSEWEFPRHHLKFIHILGEGCFGQVWKCEAVNIGNTGSSQVVAVKTLKQNATQKEKEDLLDELDVMKMLEPHPNVVTLIGCCAEQDPVLLIMEFIPNGTLQSYLRQKRGENGYGNVNGSALTSNDLISYVYQIAKGMDYLSSKGIIHRDLAARNILVGYNNVCKIADFGFAKYDHVYERKSEGRLPIRWMAVESLTDFIFTTKSDVWSFGVLMWEIVTLGWTPYPGFSAAEVIKKVCEGQRLEKPEHCKREIFNIMYYCWNENPAKRPTFSELVSLLDKILYSENDYIELDRFPDHGYYNILKPGTTGEKL